MGRGFPEHGVQLCALLKILQRVWNSPVLPESRFAGQRSNCSHLPFQLKFAWVAGCWFQSFFQ